MSAGDLAPLESAVAGLLTSMEPAARLQLARQLAQKLRASQAQRIAAQLDPDGTAYAPRKQTLRGKRGGIRRTMFGKLRTAKWLKTEATPASAAVTFANQVQRIARVHQFGLRDKVSRRGGPEVDYPARRLLGFSAADVAMIDDLLLDHVARRAG